MSSQISFKYYPQGSARSPNGDGDIKNKAARLSSAPRTPYNGLSISKICKIAIEEWLTHELDEPSSERPTMQPPLAITPESVTFSYDNPDIKELVKKLQDQPGSLYKHLDASRIYVIGINAWLDKKLAEHNPYPSSSGSSIQ
jgi:hypothetical protein